MVNIYNKTKKGGFTLMELIVVIAIIALLSVIVLVSLGDAKDKARNSQAQQESRSLQNALELYRAEKGVYPVNYSALSDSELWTSFKTLMIPYVDVDKLKSMVYPGPGPVLGSSNFYYIPPNSAQFYGSGYFDWRCGNPANGTPEQPVRGKYMVTFYSAVPLTLDSLYYSDELRAGYYCFTAK